MKLTFGGKYKKYTLIQEGRYIQLHNNKSDETEKFINIRKDSDDTYQLGYTSLEAWQRNKKFRNYIMRRWKEFCKLNPLSFFYKDRCKLENSNPEDCAERFISFMKTNIREYKLDDIL